MNTSTDSNAPASRLVTAGLVAGICDALFSSILNAFFYGSTATRVWQGVASTLMGPAAIDGGSKPVAIGLLMHFGVAFGWAAIFFVLFNTLPWLRAQTRSAAGAVAVASLYGPIIWLVMSLAVIPALVHHPTVINFRWWVQFFGHIPFVAFPIVYLTGKR